MLCSLCQAEGLFRAHCGTLPFLTANITRCQNRCFCCCGGGWGGLGEAAGGLWGGPGCRLLPPGVPRWRCPPSCGALPAAPAGPAARGGAGGLQAAVGEDGVGAYRIWGAEGGCGGERGGVAQGRRWPSAAPGTCGVPFAVSWVPFAVSTRTPAGSVPPPPQKSRFNRSCWARSAD